MTGQKIALKGYVVDKKGNLVRDPKRGSVSAQLQRRAQQIVRYGKGKK